MNQAALAHKAGVTQPNLSAMERGEREVSLRTLRALALALDIRPGLLADGIGPKTDDHPTLSRERLERIAGAVAKGTSLSDPEERKLAEGAALLASSKLRVLGPSKGSIPRRSSRQASQAWLSMSSKYKPEEVQSLLERISEKAEHGS